MPFDADRIPFASTKCILSLHFLFPNFIQINLNQSLLSEASASLRPARINGSRQKDTTSSSVIKHQMTGSQKITAIYWNLGIRSHTNRILPISSITRENINKLLALIADNLSVIPDREPIEVEQDCLYVKDTTSLDIEKEDEHTSFSNVYYRESLEMGYILNPNSRLSLYYCQNPNPIPATR